VGSLFRPKYPPSGWKFADAKAAGVLKTSDVWWLKYRANGRVIRESSGTDKRDEAMRLLKRKEGAAVEGRPVIMREDKVTITQLAETLRADYKANGRRSADRLEVSLAHLLPFFGERKAVQLPTSEITRYKAARQEEGAANATINRELAALKRMYRLAVDGELIHRAPRISKLEENNVRKGFFERDQFEAVRRHLSADRPRKDAAKPSSTTYPGTRGRVATFAYITGWRIRSEVLALQWSQVDFKAGTVRLEPGTTKNKEGRVFYMTPELRATLEEQRAATEAVQRATGRIIPLVFHRNGSAIRGFRKAWMTACRRAGVPGRILHDFRRTAVRNLERAGVARSAAMKMVGHKTESIYRRYAIVDDAMLREASEKLARAEAARG